MNELRSRGISDPMIRNYRLGFDGRRITIPITNIHKDCINVRCYLPGAPGNEKMRNKRGHGGIRLFPIDQLKYDKIVICGGEIKAIATADRINRKGFGAITATAGEGNWHNDFSQEFKGKEVFVCYDIDTDGTKAANSICARLLKYTKRISKIDLPLSKDRYPKGDINDYFGLEKQTGEDFIALLQKCKDWEPKSNFDVEDTGPPIDVPLSDSTKAEFTGKRVTVNANIAAIDTAPYIIPKTVKALCDRSQDCCSVCPIFNEVPAEDNSVTMRLHPESAAVIDMVATPKNFQRDALIEGLKMPKCKVVEFRSLEYFNVEDVRLSPQLEITSRAINDVLLPSLCIGHGLETNESYVLTGRMYPHPKTQQSILLISEVKTSQDALSKYSPSEQQLLELGIFQPKEWTLDSLSEKLDDIYKDLSANVTRIFKRQPLHLMIDLTYHSALFFNFDGNLVKGWVETLIAGDSSQGKSETILRLMDHYDLGERVECKNATVAGLLGGLQQLGKRWFVTWGIIPKHDKRIVFMEEIKGTSTEVISKLTDMRSSGIAEIPKIEKRRTHARTRLCMVSNPRSDRPLSMYSFGVDAVKELIGSPEDIRRFDAVLLVSTQEIDPNELNQLQQLRPVVKHKYKNTLCHSLILWAWTRTAEQVKFEDEAKSNILDSATKLCDEYTEVIPIVDRGSMRYKLARLSIALAARTFSTVKDSDGSSILVRKCHVEYISKFLNETYSNPIFGYKDFSESIRVRDTLVDSATISTKITQTPYPKDLIKNLLYTNAIELRDFCDWCAWERNEATQLLSLLVRKHALVRDGRSYRKTSQFIVYLKKLLDSPKLASHDRPRHVEEF